MYIPYSESWIVSSLQLVLAHLILVLQTLFETLCRLLSFSLGLLTPMAMQICLTVMTPGHDGQVSSAWSRPDEIAKIDETWRGTFTSLKFGRERPTWPKCWLALISSIRMFGMLCVWEIFAGAVGLTSAFANAGWPMRRPLTFCSVLSLVS